MIDSHVQLIKVGPKIGDRKTSMKMDHKGFKNYDSGDIEVFDFG